MLGICSRKLNVPPKIIENTPTLHVHLQSSFLCLVNSVHLYGSGTLVYKLSHIKAFFDTLEW